MLGNVQNYVVSSCFSKISKFLNILGKARIFCKEIFKSAPFLFCFTFIRYFEKFLKKEKVLTRFAFDCGSKYKLVLSNSIHFNSNKNRQFGDLLDYQIYV
jgi:hypothetical protein